jgi:hypothetical protein
MERGDTVLARVAANTNKLSSQELSNTVQCSLGFKANVRIGKEEYNELSYGSMRAGHSVQRHAWTP